MELVKFPPRSESKTRLICCVENCRNSYKKDLDVRFYKFPAAGKRFVYAANIFGKLEKIDQFEAWKGALKICEVKKSMKVCSVHFTKDDFILFDTVGKRKHLKKNAVPSINLPERKQLVAGRSCENQSLLRIRKGNKKYFNSENGDSVTPKNITEKIEIDDTSLENQDQLDEDSEMLDDESSSDVSSIENLSPSSDDSDSCDNYLQKRSRIESHIEKVASLYSENEFVRHFRVSRCIAEDISNRFYCSDFFFHQSGVNGKLSALQYTLIFLWYAGHDYASYREVAEKCNISVSTLNKIIRRMSIFLSNLSPQVIKWPDEEEKIAIETSFRNNGFPGAIGVIDGIRVKISKPENDSSSYSNGADHFMIHAQIVCDNDKRIRDVYIGFPGSVHDAEVFNLSPLMETLEEKCGENYYILGDSKYPCMKHLMTPFADKTNITSAEQNYNIKLHTNRYVMEQTTSILKQKFRQLRYVKMRKIQDIVHFIRACFVLHNLALNDEFPEEELLSTDCEVDLESSDTQVNIEDDLNGIEQRSIVTTMLESCTLDLKTS